MVGEDEAGDHPEVRGTVRQQDAQIHEGRDQGNPRSGETKIRCYVIFGCRGKV